jgi:hypothetical protein
VKFEKQHRRLRQRELRIGVAGPDLQRIEQLDAGDRNAGLDGEDRGLAAGLDAAIASGMPDRRSVSSVMTPSVPSEPTISRVRS